MQGIGSEVQGVRYYLPRLLAGLANGGREMVELAEKLPQNSSVSCCRLDTRRGPSDLKPQTSARAIVTLCLQRGVTYTGGREDVYIYFTQSSHNTE